MIHCAFCATEIKVGEGFAGRPLCATCTTLSISRSFAQNQIEKFMPDLNEWRALLAMSEPDRTAYLQQRIRRLEEVVDGHQLTYDRATQDLNERKLKL